MADKHTKTPPGGSGRGDANGVGCVTSERRSRRAAPCLPSSLRTAPPALGERLEPVHLDRREMHEDVFATFLLNEAVPLGVIEPLHLSRDHSKSLLQSQTIGHERPLDPLSSAR